MCCARHMCAHPASTHAHMHVLHPWIRVHARGVANSPAIERYKAQSECFGITPVSPGGAAVLFLTGYDMCCRWCLQGRLAPTVMRTGTKLCVSQFVAMFM